ncbi:CFI-box-CTERM domain-containing protein [Bdellovibrio sp. HCB209]|uniref:CFI-box-CTERM domain-containing protein n=1 Tax=Bdellovibrio sp. HCB209 TaxID=3394354 RepID=UPI0039B3DDDA
MRLLKLSTLFSASLLSSSIAMAALTYNNVTGMTSIDTTTTPTKPVIYGGYAGTCATMDNSTPCDSCANGTGLFPCNTQSIYPSLNLVITLNSSTAIGSSADVSVKMDTTTINPRNISIGSGSLMLTIPWSDICSAANSGDTTCNSRVNKDMVITAGTSSGGSTGGTFTFHISTAYADASTASTYIDCPDDNSAPLANSGFCHFTAFPGDSKVYADNLGTSDGYPGSTSSIDFKSLVFFYEVQPSGESNTTTVGRISTKSPVFEVSVNNTVSPPLVDERITGLNNGETYCMVMANRDLVGNIYYFTPTTGGTAVNVDSLCATPEPVAGLLDDKHCFIATAAFGSDMAPEVQSFRDFRNKYLIPYSLGRDFVKTYYKYSPKYANLIAQSDTAKTVVRAGLWPLLFFARMSVAIGFWASLAIVIFASLTLWGLYRRLIIGVNVRGEL